MRKGIYLARDRASGKLMVVRSNTHPTMESHGAQYGYAIGPFCTLKAANFLRTHRYVLTVTDAERLSKED